MSAVGTLERVEARPDATPRGRRFPWGSLLRGVLDADPAVVGGMARVMCPDATATLLLARGADPSLRDQEGRTARERSDPRATPCRRPGLP